MTNQHQRMFELTQALTGVGLHVLGEREQREAFCRRFYLHPAQSALKPERLQRLSESTDENRILLLRDPIGLCFFLFRAGSIPAAMGPFFQHAVSEETAEMLQRQLGLRSKVLLTYSGQFPVIAKEDALYALQMLLKACGERTGRLLISVEADSEETEERRRKERNSDSPLLRRRYDLERLMMESVAQGLESEAVTYYRQLCRDAAHPKPGEDILQAEKTGAVIARTTVRIAADRQGLPAAIGDRITRKHGEALASITEPDKVRHSVEALIREFCKEIRVQRDHGYSEPVMQAVSHLEQIYGDPKLSIGELSKILGVSADRLSRQFHRETGVTLSAYLRRMRMERAAGLLLATELSVQEIGRRVGIPDATYFAKQFREIYGETPQRYRNRKSRFCGADADDGKAAAQFS